MKLTFTCPECDYKFSYGIGKEYNADKEKIPLNDSYDVGDNEVVCPNCDTEFCIRCYDHTKTTVKCYLEEIDDDY